MKLSTFATFLLIIAMLANLSPGKVLLKKKLALLKGKTQLLGSLLGNSTGNSSSISTTLLNLVGLLNLPANGTHHH